MLLVSGGQVKTSAICMAYFHCPEDSKGWLAHLSDESGCALNPPCFFSIFPLFFHLFISPSCSH